MLRGVTWVVLAALLSGCMLLPEPPEPERAATPAHAAPLAPAASSPPPRFTAFVGAPRIPVTMDVEDRWVTPDHVVNATAASPTATGFEWYLASRNPIRVGPPLLHATLQPGTAAVFPLDAEGRHVLALDGSDARVGVTVVRDAMPLRVLVQVVGEGPDARFVPEDAFTGVGGSLFVERPEGAPVHVRAEDPMRPLGSGPSVSFAMPRELELGDYDLVVVAREGGDAWGEAAARLIYDKRKPDARAAWEHQGRFALGVDAEAGRWHGWSSEFDLRSLRVRVDLRSSAPVDPAVRVRLLDAEDREVAASEGGMLEVADLPRGAYGFHVAPRSGVMFDYRLAVEVERVLVPPASFFNS